MTSHAVIEEDGRFERRKNMFVMATIYADSGSAPVKIRNLSSTGALIDGTVIPIPSTRIRLSRGGLTIVGQVIWQKGTLAGVRFDSRASVAEWLPKGSAAVPQEQVDLMAQKIRAAPSGLPVSAEPQTQHVSASEITRVKCLLEALSEELADEIDLVTRVGSRLQSLDVAAQILGRLAFERA